MNFGQAIAVLKNDGRVCREGWNGKGMWLTLIRPHASLSSRLIGGAPEGMPPGTYKLLPWIGMKTTDDGFVPWLASQTDVLAEDWMTVP